MSKQTELEFFQDKLNLLKGLEYNDYETKIALIKENLKNITLLLVKGSYLEKRGFNKIMELRYNNSGFSDDFGIGEKELFSIIDKMVREKPLEKVIYTCLTTMEKDVSFIAFYTY